RGSIRDVVPLQHACQSRLAKLVRTAQDASIGHFTLGVESQFHQYISALRDPTRILDRRPMRQSCSGIYCNAWGIGSHLRGTLQGEEPDRDEYAGDGERRGSRDMG